ncbi:N-acetylmuramoyl-L-alanine amidase, partial [Parabacteroides distasonis]
EGFNPNSSESYIMFEFLQDKNMANSVELAKFVQKRTCASAQRQNKGVKQAGFLVLRETSMPSCLIELGFISTPDEERFLNSDQGVKSLAFGIFQAFCEYRAKYDKSVTVPFKATQYEDFAATRK